MVINLKEMSYYINNLNILYEDNHLIVLEKFQDVLSQKDETNDISMNDIVKEYIRVKYNKPGNVYVGLVHRLDRRVGGVMVFAKTSKASQRLSEDIKNHNFKKRYIAFCLGELSRGEYFDKLYKDEKKRIATISKNGKDAILNYELINSVMYNGKIHSYVKIDLKTGRYNQIRCQLSYHNHPLVNDYKYGYLLSQGGNIGLWCYEISFHHPTTKEVMKFTLFPKDDIWKGLKK